MSNCQTYPSFIGCFPSCSPIDTKMCFKETGQHIVNVYFSGKVYQYKIHGIRGARIHLSHRHFNENGISTFTIMQPSGSLLGWSGLNAIGVDSPECECYTFKVKMYISYSEKQIDIEDLFCPPVVVCCPEEEAELEVSIIHNYVPNVRPPIDDWIASLIIPEYCEGQGDIRWTLPDGTTRECVPRIIMPENGTYMVEYICPETGCGLNYSFEFDQI